jgi:hypothetical protein
MRQYYKRTKTRKKRNQSNDIGVKRIFAKGGGVGMFDKLCDSLLSIADAYAEQAQELRRCVSELQQATAEGEEAKFFEEVNALNARRVSLGVPPLLPVITDTFPTDR